MSCSDGKVFVSMAIIFDPVLANNFDPPLG